jgi:hypothetical protein
MTCIPLPTGLECYRCTWAVPSDSGSSTDLECRPISPHTSLLFKCSLRDSGVSLTTIRFLRDVGGRSFSRPYLGIASLGLEYTWQTGKDCKGLFDHLHVICHRTVLCWRPFPGYFAQTWTIEITHLKLETQLPIMQVPVDDHTVIDLGAPVPPA